jgi:hypothetical protein
MFSSLVVLVGFLIKISNGTAPKIRRTLHLSYRQAIQSHFQQRIRLNQSKQFFVWLF